LSDRLNLRLEIQRKAIHMAASVIPLAYLSGVPEQVILYMLLFLSVGFLAADLLRMKFALAEKYFLIVFSALLREKELKKQITGATFLLWGMTAAVFLFPKEAAVPAMLFISLADPAAAIAGKAFGKEAFYGKTIEGLLGFYLTASAVVLIFTDYSWAGLLIALASAVLEFLPLGINDNFLIPVVSGYLFMVFR